MPFDLLEAARALIAVDTVSAHGNAAIVAPLRGLAEASGLTLSIFEDPLAGARQANLLFELPRNSRRDPLLLVTHTDTVAPGPREAWTHSDPFVATRDGDRLYGLGSADVKVDLLCKLLALERVRGAQLRRSVSVLGTFGEEIGLLGAKEFVHHGPFRARQVVCGEPSELTLIHAHKGYLVARVVVGKRTAETQAAGTPLSYEGRAAHSSTPHLGSNAIQKALFEFAGVAVAIRGGQGANSVPARCEVIPAAPEVSGPGLPLGAVRALSTRFEVLARALVPDRDARFSPPGTVTNLGWIEGAAGRVEFLLDCRLLPGQSPQTLADLFTREVEGAGGTVAFERQNPAMSTPADAELCLTAQETSRALGLDATLKTKATNTEAAAFAAAPGPPVEAIVFGPGPSVGNAHCPDEHTYIPQLFQAVDWYERLILTLCH